MWVDFSGIRTGMVEVEEMDWPQDPTTTIVLFLTDEAKILIQHLRHPVCECEGVGVCVHLDKFSLLCRDLGTDDNKNTDKEERQ